MAYPRLTSRWSTVSDVILIFDKDIETNHDVWDGAQRFAKALKAEGAKSIKFVILPAAGAALTTYLPARTRAGESPT